MNSEAAGSSSAAPAGSDGRAAERTSAQEAAHDAEQRGSEGEVDDRSGIFAGVAGYVDNLRAGEQAELRRLRGRYRELPPEVFWRIVDRYGIPPYQEEFWMAVLPLMVEHPHEPQCRTGRVLARSGVSSARLEKWLRLDQQGALDEAGRLLSQVEGPINWVQFGFLLSLWNHPEHGERNRRELARDFFLALQTRQSSSKNQGGA